jgi:hypothetical protein
MWTPKEMKVATDTAKQEKAEKSRRPATALEQAETARAFINDCFSSFNAGDRVGGNQKLAGNLWLRCEKSDVPDVPYVTLGEVFSARPCDDLCMETIKAMATIAKKDKRVQCDSPVFHVSWNSSPPVRVRGVGCGEAEDDFDTAPSVAGYTYEVKCYPRVSKPGSSWWPWKK